MSSKEFTVQVTTAEAQLEFTINANTTGEQIFDQVVRTIALREIWYFGLQFTDKRGAANWIKFNKRVLAHDIAPPNKQKDIPLQLKFCAKFFPEDVAEELIEPVTLRLFYLQLKKDVLSAALYCPPEACVLLASYNCQAKHGDFTQELPGKLQVDQLLPKKVIDQHELSEAAWLEKITAWHREHKDMLKEDAMLEYLKIVQDLDMYGVTYFDILNKNKTELLLGVDSVGLNIYQKSDRLTPKVGFPWSEIKKISFQSKKFIIQPTDKSAQNFVFYSGSSRENKKILGLGIGNHNLYIRRRKDDSIEVQQMKLNAKELRDAKMSDRERIIAERSAREHAESRMAQLESSLRTSADRNTQAERQLGEYQRRIDELEHQVDTLNRQKREMDEARARLERSNAELDAARRTMNTDVQRLEAENRQIQAEVQLKHREVEQTSGALRDKQAELERMRVEREQNEQRIQQMEAVNQSATLAMNMDFEKDEANLESLERIDDQRELNRQTMLSTNVDLQNAMKMLSQDLQQHRTQSHEQDRQHEANKQKGLDKFQTLREIRQGNTKKRVDQFEMM